jgi:hypothetical protein
MGNAVDVEMRDELFDGTDFREGHIPEWVDKLVSVIAVLETLSQKSESRKCTLWMIVPLVEAAKRDLLSKADSKDLELIHELALNLAFRLTARLR